MQTDPDTDTSATADAPVNDLPIDGGEPTAEEAAQAKALEEHGDAPAPAATDDSDAATAEAQGQPPADTTADAGDDTPAPAPAPAAAAPDPAPEAAKDFDAEAKALLDKYNDGDLDEADYQSASRALNKEEATHMAKVAVWEDRQERAQADQTDAFNRAALAWQEANAEFVANPLHVKSMNEALELVSQQHPEFTAEQLVAEAGKVTFEAFHYTPPAPEDTAGKIARATAARRPATETVPPSARHAPAAASLDPGKSSFGQLDDLGISELEDAVARLPEGKIDEFLRDAPGATSRGS